MKQLLNRRSFVVSSLGMAAAIALPRLSVAQEGTPEASSDFSPLEIVLTDTGFDFPQPLVAGRYQVTVSNIGTSADSHSALGKIPDRVTDAQYEEWLGTAGDTEALKFDDIDFVGLPDWPKPGGQVTGVIDLAPGRYLLFDPFEARGHVTVEVDGEVETGKEPAADITVELLEMELVLPDAIATSAPVRWKIENKGAMIHEVAVLPVAADFTEEHLHILFSLPEEATPPPGVPPFEYLPVAAIGLLAKQQTSWLDVQLQPGRHLAACMAPFGTGYPHAVDGMYRFFDVM